RALGLRLRVAWHAHAVYSIRLSGLVARAAIAPALARTRAATLQGIRVDGRVMAIDELEFIRTLLASKPRPTAWSERRQRLDEVGTVWPVADDVTLERADVGGLPAEWSIAPGSDASRVLVFLHGGGYCSGSIASHRRMVTEAGRAAGLRTLAVGYRLAPEHPFPAAHEDAMTAWRFVRRQGIAAGHIAGCGDRAGAGLSLALVNMLRDAGEALPGWCGLGAPW